MRPIMLCFYCPTVRRSLSTSLISMQQPRVMNSACQAVIFCDSIVESCIQPRLKDPQTHSRAPCFTSIFMPSTLATLLCSEALKQRPPYHPRATPASCALSKQ
eukprot:scaffold164688_cov14-Tisochrysis_lutea.AAC.1